MSSKSLLLFFVVLVLASCDDNTKRVLPNGRRAIIAEKDFPKDKQLPIDIPPAPAPYSGPKRLCFQMDLGNPNEMTQMNVILDDNDSLRGSLDYHFADKPLIHGAVEGIKAGKFIELNYAYTDSGIHKVEQLVLKLENDKLYKKTGPLVEEDGRIVLENPLKAKLQLFLMKVDCK